jgi:hypothetical protein
MPAKTHKNQTARATTAKRGCQRKGKKTNRARREGATRMPAKRQALSGKH